MEGDSNVNKNDLIAKVADVTDLAKAEATKAVDSDRGEDRHRAWLNVNNSSDKTTSMAC